MAGPDLSIVMAAVDFSTVLPAVLGVLAALIVVYVAMKGVKMIAVVVRGDSYWETYSYEDDCRDRENAGLERQTQAEWDKYNP